MYRARDVRRGTRAVLGLLACAAMLSACGGDDDEPASTGANGEAAPATLKVGVIPIADVAPL